jgi:hypothetical protein
MSIALLLSSLLVAAPVQAGEISTDFAYEAPPTDLSFAGLSVSISDIQLRTDLSRHLTNADRAQEKLGEAAPRLVGGGYNAYGMLMDKYLVTTTVEQEVRDALATELTALGMTVVAGGEAEAPALNLNVVISDLFFVVQPRAGRIEWSFEGDLDLTFQAADGSEVWSGNAEHHARDIKAVYGRKAVQEDTNAAFSELVKATVRGNGAALQALTLAAAEQ